MSARPIEPPTDPPPRRTELPLPSRRYVPGLGPHPDDDPAHVLPEVDDPERAFAYACDLYDHRFHWEAHEVWEGLWHAASPGSPRWLALKGLIQLTAAALKPWQGLSDVAPRLLERARHHLERAGLDVFGDVDLHALRTAIRQGSPPEALPRV